MTFEQKPERNSGESHVGIWREESHTEGLTRANALMQVQIWSVLGHSFGIRVYSWDGLSGRMGEEVRKGEPYVQNMQGLVGLRND